MFITYLVFYLKDGSWKEDKAEFASQEEALLYGRREYGDFIKIAKCSRSTDAFRTSNSRISHGM